MRKTISLLALLLLLCTSAWADTQLFYLEVSSSSSDVNVNKGGGTHALSTPSDLSSLSGGTATLKNTRTGTGSDKMLGSDNSERHIRLKQDLNYVVLTLNNALAKGDIITFTTDKSTNQICFTATESKSASIITTSKSYTIPTSSELIGKTTIYIWRNSGDTYIKTLTITRPTVKTPTSEVLKSSSAVKVGSTTLTKDAGTNGYIVDGSTITISDDIDYLSTPTNIKLVKTITYDDSSTAEEDVDVTFDGSTTAGYYTGTASIGLKGSVTNYTVKAKKDATPTLSLSSSSGSISLKSYEGARSVTVTLTGANLTEGTVITPSPSVAGVTISPESVTVPASGEVSQEFTFTTTASTAASTVITFSHTGATSKTYTLSYSKTAQRSLSQVNVSSATTWDWSKAYNSANVQLTDATSPTKSEEFLLSNIAEVNNDANFNAQALVVKTEYATRKDGSNYMMQGYKVTFHTTVPGLVDVDFSNTGGSRPYRYLCVNGVVTEFKSASSSTIENATNIYVPAGDVIISGYIPDASDPAVRDGDNVGETMLRIYKVVFTPLAESVPSTVGATITACGYNTFSSIYPLDLSTLTSGMTAYVVSSITDSKAVLTATKAKVPARTGIIVKGTSGAFTIATTSDATTTPEANLLVGVPNGTTVEKASGTGYNNYVFGWEDAANPGFYLINETSATLVAGKAYLHTSSALSVAGSGSAPSVIRIVDEESNATSLSEIESSDEAVKFIQNGQLFIKRNGVVYDAMGRVIR